MSPGESKRPASPRLQTERLWYVAVSLVAILIVFSASVMALSARTSFCLSCHAAQAASLSVGGHQGISCDRCHLPSGALGVVDSRLGVVAMVPARVLGTPAGVDPRVENKRCVACHSRILIGVRETNGLRMSHVGVLGAEWPCAKCHPTSGHKAPSATNTGYTMEMCVPCHFTSTKNLASCDLCHPAGKGSLVRPAWPTPFSIVHGPQWRVAHGMGDLATCKACHDQGYCARCHHMEVPHQVGYVQVHGKQVLAGTVKQNDCYVCHSGTSCQDCHGLPMPHPTGFVKNHPQITGRVGQQVCMRCHEAASCPDCHQRHIHPGIPAAILKQLREHPAR